jgi:ABC-type transport system involved in multi-copper enzyme maturation permease subunit
MSLSGVVESIRRGNWALWRRQVVGILAIEAKKNLIGRRAMFVYLLAFAPVFLLALRLIVPVPKQAIDSIGGVSVMYAIIFRTFVLRLAVFFGCVGIFTRLIRGDMLERILHYYLLSPVRREVLITGKYLAGVLSTGLIFGVSTVLSYILLQAPAGWVAFEEFVIKGPGFGHLVAYVGLVVLACIGYGAVFLLIGLFFRNPIVPAAVILGWEYINFLLPPLLKKFSVIYYLESLCPVPIPQGSITILAEPAPAWLAIPGLLLVSGLILLIAGLKVRHMEISYAEE